MPVGHGLFRSAILEGRGGVAGAVVRAGAAAAEPLYAGAISLRNLAYDHGWLASRPLGRPVISVGNVSAGGTGKTPVVAMLAGLLRAHGHHPAMLLRGYARKPGEKADEQLELEGALGPEVPVHADADRVRGAADVLRKHPGTTCFLLDDGFQHRRACRDLDLVLVSATQGLCGGRVLPRGLLRERPSGLARAGVVLLTRADAVDPGTLSRLAAEVARHLRPGTPVLTCRHAVTDVISSAGRVFPPGHAEGRRWVVAVGTGDPAAVLATFRGLGVDVAGECVFPDHHAYTPADADRLLALARDAGAEALACTAKDAVKLAPLLAGRGTELYTPRVRAVLEDAPALTRLVLAAAGPT